MKKLFVIFLITIAPYLFPQESDGFFSDFDVIVDSLESDLADVREKLSSTHSLNAELLAKLENASSTIVELRTGLDQVSERMQSSNEWLAAAYDDLEELDKTVAVLKVNLELAKEAAKRNGTIGFSVGGVSVGLVGAGSVLLMNDAKSTTGWVMFGAGGAIAVAWTIGHVMAWW